MDKFLRDIRLHIEESVRTKQMPLSDEALMSRIARIAGVVVEAYKAGHKTLWAGNGGSAADAQHMAGELVNKFTFDRPGLAALSLSTDTSIITAVGNDSTGCSPARWKPRDARATCLSASPPPASRRTS